MSAFSNKIKFMSKSSCWTCFRLYPEFTSGI